MPISIILNILNINVSKSVLIEFYLASFLFSYNMEHEHVCFTIWLLPISFKIKSIDLSKIGVILMQKHFSEIVYHVNRHGYPDEN
jgi:hypothetical protein